MAVGIFTSRVTLQYLGITDYGIYQSVGGIVGMVTFANTAITTGISRFITFGLGEGDIEKLRRVFSTLLTMQFVFIAVLLLIGETVGLWFVMNKLVIPEASRTAALWAYQLSLLTMALSMLTDPFNAEIVAHEDMNVFAYLSMGQSFAGLGIAYALMIAPSGRLYIYATLLFLISLVSLSIYIGYSYKKYPETNFKLQIDKSLYKEVASFSGWSLFAAFSIALMSQGVLVMLNMFFAPAVVSARAISLTVNSYANQFVGNFRNAMNPQIVKQYASGEYETSRKLLLTSTKMSFFLMLIMSVPIFYTADILLSTWLAEVPEYSTIFLKLVIIQSLFQVFDTSFYAALYAKGRLKENALISPLGGFLGFPIVYLLFKLGYSPVALSWVLLIIYAILGVVVKPILLVKIVNYNWGEILATLKTCFIVGIIAFALGYPINYFIHSDNFGKFILEAGILVITTIGAVFLLGMDKGMKTAVRNLLVSKLRIKNVAK